VADDVDLEVELEREELADLLDRALALLPAETRRMLVERYLHERPQAEVAAGLHRGKLALLRVLRTDFPAEATSYRLLPAKDDGGWQETRLWCPECGRRHLVGRLSSSKATTRFQVRCPACHTVPGAYMANALQSDYARLLAGARGYRSGLARMMDWTANFYLPTRARPPARRTVTCPHCTRTLPLRAGMPQDGPPSLRDSARRACPLRRL
jgi:hypothetical protein